MDFYTLNKGFLEKEPFTLLGYSGVGLIKKGFLIMKKNKIISLFAMVSLWATVAVANLEQYCVVVFTKDECGNTRTYVGQVPEENVNIDALVESSSIVHEGQLCDAKPLDKLHYAIEALPMQSLDQETLPLYIRFTLQVEQGQELLRVMIVKNNFFEDKIFDVDTVAIDILDVDELDDLDALLADSKTDALDSIETKPMQQMSSTQQMLLSLSVFFIDQYTKSQEIISASSEWISRFFQ